MVIMMSRPTKAIDPPTTPLNSLLFVDAPLNASVDFAVLKFVGVVEAGAIAGKSAIALFPMDG